MLLARGPACPQGPRSDPPRPSRASAGRSGDAPETRAGVRAQVFKRSPRPSLRWQASLGARRSETGDPAARKEGRRGPRPTGVNPESGGGRPDRHGTPADVVRRAAPAAPSAHAAGLDGIRERAKPGDRCRDQHRHVPRLVLVAPHLHVGVGDLLPREDLGHAGVEAPLDH